MDLVVTHENDHWTARWAGESHPCAVGRSGVIAGAQKREGDGASPAGAWTMRRLLYRADRLPQPETGLPLAAIAEDDGWCDDPQDSAYNQAVRLPHAASHERLWRDDEIYDLIVVLGHNDAPVRPGLGSAIFLHCARPDFTPTEGCVALQQQTLLRLLADAKPGDRVIIEEN